MSVVVYIESQKGVVKKAGLEIASFGRAIADASQDSLVAVTFNLEDTSTLKLYGVDKVYNVNTEEDNFFNVERYANSIQNVVLKEAAKI